jgi:undecaprenyl-diphosphatase
LPSDGDKRRWHQRWRDVPWGDLPWKSLALAAVAAAAFGVFLEIGDEVLEDEHGDLDAAVLRAFAGHRHPVLDSAVAWLSHLGDFPVLVAVTTLAAALLLRGRDRLGAVQLLISAIGGGLLVRGAKMIVARPRPEVVDRVVEVTGYSFPSGHSMGAAAVFLTLALVLRRHLPPRWWWPVMAASAVLVAAIALTRVYLGVHFASDIAAGVAFGAAWVLVVAAAVSAWLHRSRRRGGGPTSPASPASPTSPTSPT